MNLGEHIYHYRIQKNLSQGDLAEQLDVSRQSVSKWENNSAVPELEKLMKMASIFGITIDELVTGEESPRPTPTPPPAPVIPTPQAAPEGFPARKLIGILCLSMGLLCSFVCIILSIVLEESHQEDLLTVALGLGLPVAIVGICCLLAKKHTALVCGWALDLPLWVVAFVLMVPQFDTVQGLFMLLVTAYTVLLSAVTLVKLWTGKIQTSLFARILLTILICLLVATSVIFLLPPKSYSTTQNSTVTVVVPSIKP